MKRILYSTFIVSAMIFSLTGCYKEGCMDAKADNYDEDANTSDLSCEYSGSVYFWADPVVSDSLLNIEGHPILRFELEGEIVDSVATQAFVALEGSCGGSGQVTIKRTFAGNDDVWNYKYRVKGSGFITLYEGFVTIDHGECVGVRLL